jgi:NitT/TauT family transport system substrate-binding protein
MVAFFAVAVLTAIVGCSKSESTPTAPNLTSAVIGLNWVPEPEFGGIYAAQQTGAFTRNGLFMTIQPADSSIWQQVAAGTLQFGVVSADEVIIARSQGADVVAIFTTFQTNPQGIMAHASRGLKDVSEVFKSGTLACEPGLAYVKFIEKKYGVSGDNVVPYQGGITTFLNDKNYAQQCFVFSEPLLAKKQGSDPQTFLIADAGYNPYTGVIITSGDYLKTHADIVKKVTDSLREGWRAYLDDPKPANDAMHLINPNMDLETFAADAQAQESLIENADTKANGLGTMTLDRWKQLCDQLVDLKIVTSAPKPADCFVNL